MRSRGDSATQSFAVALIASGLIIGVFGSYSDDILGASGAVSILQVLLWVVSALTVVAGIGLAARGRPEQQVTDRYAARRTITS